MPTPLLKDLRNGHLAAILTGRPPFVGPSKESARQLAANKKLQDCFARLDASGADPELVALCKRCLAPEKDDRPADASAVAAAVATFRAESEARAKNAEVERERATVREAEQRKRQRQLRSAAGVVGMVLAAGVAVSLWQMFRAQNAEFATATQLTKTQQAEAATLTQLKLTQEAEAATAAQLKLTRIAEEKAKEETKKVQTALGVATERTKSLSDAYGDFVFGIQNRMQNRPGTLEIRKELLGIARAGLRKIIHDARKVGNADRTILVSYFKLGDVELVLGNAESAKVEYDAGHELAQSLAVADPKNAQAQRDLSISYDNLGNVSLKRGQTKEALAFYQKYNELCEKLAVDPMQAEAQRDLSISYNNLGNVTLQLGQAEDSLAFYQKGLLVAEKLAATDPKKAQAQRDLRGYPESDLLGIPGFWEDAGPSTPEPP